MDRGRELGSSAALMSTTPSDDDVCAAAREILEHTDLATTTGQFSCLHQVSERTGPNCTVVINMACGIMQSAKSGSRWRSNCRRTSATASRL